MGLPSLAGVEALVHIHPVVRGLPIASFHCRVGFAPARCLAAALLDGTAKCPESLCPMAALPPTGETCTPSPARTLLLGHRSCGLIRQSRLALLSFGLSLVQEVSAGCFQPLLPPGSSRRYFCESFLGCLVPCHAGPTKCTYLFLPPCHRPSPTEVWVGFPA